MINKNEALIKIGRRDFLAKSSLSLSALGLGLPRATLAAPEPAKLAPKGAKIASIVIFPAIGICRIGNSEKIFYAPELPGVPSNPEGGYKDSDGKVKKQVQRFRVYGFDDEGRVVRELTTQAGDSIEWTVHVANTKAAWYKFNSPMDMGKQTPGLTGQERNAFFTGKERNDLLIDPGPAEISGASTAKSPVEPVKMTGGFWKKPNRVSVNLGELRTDDAGRLLVVPGKGVGGSATKGNPITSFSDNDGWYDDWCDGPVSASVTLKDGSRFAAENAWVTCCGPDFSPEINSFITLYDVIRDTMVNGKAFAGKKALLPSLKPKLSFLEEIYPLFLRLGQMEWVAAASNLRQGWIDVKSFLSEEYMDKLGDPSKKNQAFRQSILKKFRNPSNENVDEFKLPYMLGSGANYDSSPAGWFIMPKLQYDILKKWAEGEFINDLNRKESKIRSIEDVPLEHQPDTLTRAALEPCSGGAFHPGVELTWPLRQEALFSDKHPFRIKSGKRKSLLQNDIVGRLLTPQTAFNRKDTMDGNPTHRSGEAYTFVPGEGAPIGPQMPGDLTRWMGLPWFGDAFSCGLAVESANDFPQAIWWPALTPIDVLPEASFKQLSSNDLSDREKLKFFENRVPWIRGIRGISLHAEASYINGLIRAVDLWSGFGFIIKKKRPDNLSPLLKKIIPEEVFVEVDRGSLDLLTGQAPFPGR